jgi:DNA-directed RNA polymerase specialized sigma subunit
MSAHSEAQKRRRLVVRLRRRRFTFAEIGEQLGISRQRAHQLYQQATK